MTLYNMLLWKHTQSHDRCRLVFPLRTWLYGNSKSDDLTFSFVSAYFFSVLQTCCENSSVTIQATVVFFVQ